LGNGGLGPLKESKKLRNKHYEHSTGAWRHGGGYIVLGGSSTVTNCSGWLAKMFPAGKVYSETCRVIVFVKSSEQN